jgi:hypothetical protein
MISLAPNAIKLSLFLKHFERERVESESSVRKVVRSEVMSTIVISVIQKWRDSICQSFYDSIKDSNSIRNKEFLVL